MKDQVQWPIDGVTVPMAARYVIIFYITYNSANKFSSPKSI